MANTETVDVDPSPRLPEEVAQVVNAWAEGRQGPARPAVLLAEDLTAGHLGCAVELQAILTRDGHVTNGRWLFTLERAELVIREGEKPGTWEHLWQLHTAGAAPTSYTITADTPILLYRPTPSDVQVVALPSGAFLTQGSGAAPAQMPRAAAGLTTVPTPGPPWDNPRHSGQATPAPAQPPATSGAPSGGWPAPAPDANGAPEKSPRIAPPRTTPLPPQPGGSDWDPTRR